MNHKRYFYNPYIILKIFHYMYMYVTFRAQTWPQYDLSFLSKTDVYVKKILGSTIPYVFCMHPVRAQTAIPPGPTHTYRLCTHTARGSSLQSSRTPNWTPYVHVAVYSLLSSRIQHHGCEFCRETWEIHICNVQTNLYTVTSQILYVDIKVNISNVIMKLWCHDDVIRCRITSKRGLIC